MEIRPGVSIPLADVTLRTSRSSGPGGQHANVTASRVEAVFDVAASSLPEEDKRRIQARLGPRVTAVAQDARGQARNRELALERLRDRLAAALKPRRPRHATRPTAGARRRRRLEQKRHRAERKRDRRRPSAGGRVASVLPRRGRVGRRVPAARVRGRRRIRPVRLRRRQPRAGAPRSPAASCASSTATPSRSASASRRAGDRALHRRRHSGVGEAGRARECYGVAGEQVQRPAGDRAPRAAASRPRAHRPLRPDARVRLPARTTRTRS